MGHSRQGGEMSGGCKGLCETFEKAKIVRHMIYHSNNKRCSVCQVNIKTDAVRCPCCQHVLRTRPRFQANRNKSKDDRINMWRKMNGMTPLVRI